MYLYTYCWTSCVNTLLENGIVYESTCTGVEETPRAKEIWWDRGCDRWLTELKSSCTRNPCSLFCSSRGEEQLEQLHRCTCSEYHGRRTRTDDRLLVSTLSQAILKEDITVETHFEVAMLEFITALNAALPGKHYEVPQRQEIKKLLGEFEQEKDPEKRKKKITDFMEKEVKLSHSDKATLFTGVLTPPLAMAAKRAGGNVPQLKIIENVPDVLFVPTATVLALISVKVSRRIFMRTKSAIAPASAPT